MKDEKDKKAAKIKPEADDEAELFLRFLEQDVVPDKDKNRVASRPPQPLKRPDAAATISLDLHGMNLADATSAVDRLLGSLTSTLKGEQRVRIITGKGRHSTAGEGVLVRGVYAHVQRQWARFIKRIDSPPADDLIEGLPLRGHFDMVLSRR